MCLLCPLFRGIQWADYGEDRSNGNWVSGNTIATYGNECVEVKEGSSHNIIEDNVCSNQRDENSGCFCARGDENIIRSEHSKYRFLRYRFCIK